MIKIGTNTVKARVEKNCLPKTELTVSLNLVQQAK